VWGDSIPPGQ